MSMLTDQHTQLAAAGAPGGGKPPGRDPLKPHSSGIVKRPRKFSCLTCGSEKHGWQACQRRCQHCGHFHQNKWCISHDTPYLKDLKSRAKNSPNIAHLVSELELELRQFRQIETRNVSASSSAAATSAAPAPAALPTLALTSDPTIASLQQRIEELEVQLRLERESRHQATEQAYEEGRSRGETDTLGQAAVFWSGVGFSQGLDFRRVLAQFAPRQEQGHPAPSDPPTQTSNPPSSSR